MKEEKVYIVEFNTYTNCMYDTVSDGNYEDLSKTEYLSIPLGGLLVRESELTKYSKFGNGYKSIKLVGSMYFKEDFE